MNITNKMRSRINIAITLVAVFAMVATPFVSTASAYVVDYGYPDYTVDYGYPDYTVDYGYPDYTVDYGYPDYTVDYGYPDYTVEYGYPDYTVDYGYPDYTVDYGYPDYNVDYGYPEYDYSWPQTSTFPNTNTCGSNCSPTYTNPTPCGTLCNPVSYPAPTYTYPTYHYPAPCTTNCTPTTSPGGTVINDNNIDNDIDNDIDNNINNTNNNVNNNANNINIHFPDIRYPDIHYPDITYPAINIINTVTTTVGGGDTTPTCNAANYWCHPQPTPQCGTWNNWCQPIPLPQIPSVYINADNTSLSSGQSTTVRWTGTNVNSCYASNGWSGSKSTTGSEFTGALFSERTYVINCTGTNNQNVSDSVTVFVNQFNNAFPTVDLTADQSFISSGQATILRWVSSNANSCYATNGWSGAKNTVGSESTGSLFSTRTYVINCTGFSGQNVTDSVTVNVGGITQPTQENTVITQSPTGVTTSQALINGTAINNVTSGTTMWFEWGTNTSLGSETPRQSVGVLSGSRSFSWTLAGLSPNTTYYYRAISETSTGVARGLILSFTTGGVLGISTGPVTGGSRVSIEKTLENRTTPNGNDGRVTAWPGDEIRYTITVENTGDTTLRNLTVVDQLPKAIVYVDGGSYDENANKVTWNIDRINVGETKTMFLDTMVTDCACAVGKSNVDNVAYVSGSQISKKTSSAATVSVSQNDLVLTLDADRNQVLPGDVVNFELTVSNGGGEMLENGMVRVILPDSLTFRSASEAYRENSNVYTFDVGTLRVGRDVVINVSAEVKDSASASENITVSTVATFEDSEGNDIVTDADETITVSADASGAAAAGLSGFFPDSFVGWLLLIILAIILILLIRWLFLGARKEDRDNKDAHLHVNHGHSGAASYRTPSAFDRHINGNENGAGTVAFDHSYGQNQAAHESNQNFPNNLPK